MEQQQQEASKQTATESPPKISSFYDHLKCGLCLELAKDIVETSCCHQMYCERCLVIAKAPKNECPSCRKTKFQVLTSHLGRRIINSIPASCPYKCDKNLTIGDLEDHKKVCPQKIFTCPEEGCEDFQGDKKAFNEHIVEKHMEKIAQMFGNMNLNNSWTKSGEVTGFFVQKEKESVMKGKFIMEKGQVYINTEDWFGHSGWKGEINEKDLSIKLMKVYNPINEIIYRGKFNRQLTKLSGKYSWQVDGKEKEGEYFELNFIASD